MLAAVAVPAADGKQFTARSGDVTATLSVRQRGYVVYRPGKLRIVHAGRTLHDAVPHPRACRPYKCGPVTHSGGPPPLRVMDLDADGEPEVIYTAFWGGAHCCYIGQFFSLRPDASGYTAVSRNFGDSPSFELDDPDGDGRPEIVTSDYHFDYEFTAYFASGKPLLLLHFDNGRFSDVTNSFPGSVRRDARKWWRVYWRHRHERWDAPRGLIAPWAADEYRLGRRRHALRILRREVRRGPLDYRGGGARFIKKLDRFLRRRGYAQPCRSSPA